MNDDKKFASEHELEDWLKTRGVDEDDVAEAANKLFAKRFNRPSNLFGISSDNLIKVGFSVPVAQHLSNKLDVSSAVSCPIKMNPKLAHT